MTRPWNTQVGRSLLHLTIGYGLTLVAIATVRVTNIVDEATMVQWAPPIAVVLIALEPAVLGLTWVRDHLKG